MIKYFSTLLFLSSLSSFLFSSSLSDFTVEEKVGQLFVVCFKGESANEGARELIQKLHVGGVIYYDWANGLHSPSQVLTLSLGLQKLALANKNPIPLLIAIDQEGGIISRLTKGFTPFPGNKALAMSDNPNLAEESAYVMGKELLAVGVNFNLAPVTDINNNPRNPVIGIRSFGNEAKTVVSFAKKALKGYKKAGVLTSIKHFPGHGDTGVDSHEDLPFLLKSKEDLDKMELIPFKELSSEADTVMTAHIMIPSLDRIHCATLSKPILSILRKKIGFKGVIIADSLVMQGVLKNSGSLEEAAIWALNAGCDLLLFGGKQLVGTTLNQEISLEEVAKIHASVVKAVKEGIISKERLDEAVQRVLHLKEKIKPVFEKTEEELNQVLCTEGHLLLSEKISSLALKSIKNSPIPDLKTQKIALFASTVLEKSIKESLLLEKGKEMTPFFFEGLNPSEEEIQKALTLADQSDTLIFLSYNAWKNQGQANLLSLLGKHKKPFILFVTRDPLDESLYPNANLIVKTFSPSASSLKAACKELP